MDDDDEEEANKGKYKDVLLPVHNENQEWEEMVPVSGMKFSNPLELKLCITNYAVKIDMIYGMRKVIIKGLLEAMKERVRAVEHRQCVRHICANFMKRACDAYQNGISESFNSVIEAARKRPLITMLEEETRIYVMERLYRQKIKGKYWDLTICSSIRLKLSKLKDLQRLGYDAYVVDIGSRTCSCRTWQLTGYPCMHGYAYIAILNRDVEEYLSPWFTTIMLLNCYIYIPLTHSMTTSSHCPQKGEGYQEDHQQKEKGIRLREKTKQKENDLPQKPIEESSNKNSKKKKPKKVGKVKLALVHEVDIDSDSEVEIESESEVDSFDVEFEDDVQPDVQPEVQDEVQHEVQPQVHTEVHPEFHPEVQDEVHPNFTLKFTLMFTLKFKLKFNLKCNFKLKMLTKL
uniref:SWIM-type domain-containing protein n=1 Tax=Lactuca sativa TaxID=4236 RepID=A0A9R1W6I2_LACSA|nr:hypothetical protein LSAT_V11C300137320 [Lactuca sativa]